LAAFLKKGVFADESQSISDSILLYRTSSKIQQGRATKGWFLNWFFVLHYLLTVILFLKSARAFSQELRGRF